MLWLVNESAIVKFVYPYMDRKMQIKILHNLFSYSQAFRMWRLTTSFAWMKQGCQPGFIKGSLKVSCVLILGFPIAYRFVATMSLTARWWKGVVQWQLVYASCLWTTSFNLADPAKMEFFEILKPQKRKKDAQGSDGCDKHNCSHRHIGM